MTLAMYTEEQMKSFENKIINMDCLDFLKKCPDNYFSLVLTDPPYGIGIDGQKQCECKNPKHNRKEHQRKEWAKYCGLSYRNLYYRLNNGYTIEEAIEKPKRKLHK